MEGLLGRPDLSVFHTSSPADAEALLKQQRFDLMILIFDEEPSSGFMDMLSKTRNLSSHRDLTFAALLTKPSRTGIQKALTLGAKELIISPTDPKTLVRTVRKLSGGIERDLTVASYFHDITPIGCEIEVLGRIGKIYLDPFGDLQLETDVRLPAGRAIKVSCQMAQEQGAADFEYTVTASGQTNIYYNYSNTYRLGWLAGPERRQHLAKWIEKSKDVFAIPKTKVLWITEKPLGDLEASFNKEIFSVYAEHPHRLSLVYLHRISPRIVIAGDLDAPVRRVLEQWLGNDRESRMLVSTSVTAPAGWLHLSEQDPDAFKNAFIYLVKPSMKERVAEAVKSAVFFSRKSDYSLCAIPIEARVTAVSKSCVRMEAPFDFEKGVILPIRCPALEDPRGYGFYGKVLASKKAAREGFFSLTCEILPISDARNPIVMEFVESLDKKEDRALARKPRTVAIQPGKAELFFLTAKPVARNLGTILLAIVGVGLLFLLAYYYIPRPDYHSTQPTRSIEDIFRAFREAFQ